jgi:hypothetical protein
MARQPRTTFLDDLRHPGVEISGEGAHWRFLATTASLPVRAYLGILDHIAPKEDDIQSILKHLESLERGLVKGNEADDALGKRISDARESFYCDQLYNFADSSMHIGRGSVYHSMMAQVDSMKGDRAGVIGHRAKEAGYKMMFIPELFGLAMPVGFYMLAGAAACTVIDGGIYVVKKMGMPDAFGGFESAISESTHGYLEGRRKKKEMNDDVHARYEELENAKS